MKFLAVGIAAACFFLAGPRSAAAQAPPEWQASAGYAFMRVPSENLNFNTGWAVGTSVRITRWLALAADVDGETNTIASFGSDITLTSHGFTAGPRASGRIGPFTEFVQVLAGTVRASGTLFGQTDTTYHTTLQPGLGLDYAVLHRWAVRGELDARSMNTGQELRGTLGLVFRIR